MLGCARGSGIRIGTDARVLFGACSLPKMA
jgi:hypothetical protein